MRAIIFANSQLTQPFSILDSDLIIAADGGAHHCLSLDLVPAVIIGDFDSLDEVTLEFLKSRGTTVVSHPARKDYTDLELALRYAQESGAEEIIILAALGGRWDQTVANILLPAVLTTTQCHIIDGNQKLYFLNDDTLLEIKGQPGDTVSLISLRAHAYGIITSGLEYPLDNETLFFGSTRGISNVLLDQSATIYLGKGLLLCTIIHQ